MTYYFQANTEKSTASSENAILDLESLESGEMRINDIIFEIPPESISIDIQNEDTSYFMLRTEAPTTKNTGKKRVIINFSLAINISLGYDDLCRLLIQIRKSPIATIENEKIRTELTGSASTNANMAFIVDRVSGYLDTNYPNIFRCNIQVSWFNHFPYMPEVLYTGDIEKQEAPYSKIPTSQYTSFYTNGTADSNGILINDPIEMDENVVEILYKEYIQDTNAIPPQTSNQEKKDEDKKIEEFQKKRAKEITRTFQLHGWTEARSRTGKLFADGIFYRWRKARLTSSDLQSSGALILQNISFILETNVSYIPLEYYSIPTVQFLGGSMASLRTIIFAAPEYSDSGREPISTSAALGVIQNLFETLSKNKSLFSEYAKDDYLLIKHPVAKLLKYKSYEKGRLEGDIGYQENRYAEDDDGNNLYTFNYDDYFTVVASDISSETIPESPFASSIQIDFKETRIAPTYKNIKKIEPNKTKKSSLFTDLLNVLIQEYDIYYDEDLKQYVIGNRILRDDTEIAKKVVSSMNALLILDDSLTNIEKIYQSSLFKTKTNLLQQKLREKVTEISKNDYLNSGGVIDPLINLATWGAAYLEESIVGRGMDKIQTFLSHKKTAFQKMLFYNQEYQRQIAYQISRLVYKKRIDGKDSIPWIAKYAPYVDQYAAPDKTIQSDLYPDLMLPEEQTDPAYYFTNNKSLTEELRTTATQGMLSEKGGMSNQAKVEKAELDLLYDNKTNIKTGGKNKGNQPSKRHLGESWNAFMDGAFQENGIKAKQMPGDFFHRQVLLQKAISTMTFGADSIANAYPAFQVFFLSDTFALTQQYSAADLKQENLKEEGRKDLLDIFDLSSILDIRIVKDEEVAADLMIIRVLATDKRLVNKGFPFIPNPSSIDTSSLGATYNSIVNIAQDIANGKTSLYPAVDPTSNSGGLIPDTGIEEVQYLSNHDGDTIRFRVKETNEIIERLRVLGVDTSEIDSIKQENRARAVAARVFTENALKNAKKITIIRAGIDDYGRPLARVNYDGKDLANELIKASASIFYQDKNYDFNSLGVPVEDLNTGKIGKSQLPYQDLSIYGIAEGVRVKALLGNSKTTSEIVVEFSGKIASISGQDVIEIVCLGNGHELVDDIKGTEGGDKYTVNSETRNLIANLFSTSEELKSFGDRTFQLVEGLDVNLVPLAFAGRSILDNIFSQDIIPKGYSGENFIRSTTTAIGTGYVTRSTLLTTVIPFFESKLLSLAEGTILQKQIAKNIAKVGGRGLFKKIIQKNIIARGATWLGRGLATTAGIVAAPEVVGIFLTALTIYEAYQFIKPILAPCPFTIYQQTIWSVLNELNLRHPGSVCGVVPFDNRSTIYFGEPDNFYFYRGPESSMETDFKASFPGINITQREILDTTTGVSAPLFDPLAETPLNQGYDIAKTKNNIGLLKREKTDKEFDQSVIMGMMKPFRSYHIISSEHDIVSNGIEVSSMEMANSVQVYGPNKSGNANFDGSEGLKKYTLTQRMQADDDLDSTKIKNKVFTFHNAHKHTQEGLHLPEKYAQALLCKELGKMYQGKIIILGRAGIKPHDICFLRDNYNQIYGAVGVTKVVHTISLGRGWTTEITPKFLAFPDTATGSLQLESVKLAAKFIFGMEAELFYSGLNNYILENPKSSTLSVMLNSFVEPVGKQTAVTKDNYLEVRDNLITPDRSVLEDILINTAGYTGGTLVGKGVTTIGSKLFQSGATALAETTLKGLINPLNLLGAAMNVGKVAGGGYLSVLGAFGGIVGMNYINAGADYGIAWFKFRQPVIISPLIKDGRMWVAGLSGFNDNTVENHGKTEILKGADKLAAGVNYAQELLRDFTNKRQ